MKDNDKLPLDTLIILNAGELVTYEEYQEILLERKAKRELEEPRVYKPSKFDDRPVRGDIYKWAEEKEKNRTAGTNTITEDDVDIMRQLTEKRNRDLKRSYAKAIRDARASRNK